MSGNVSEWMWDLFGTYPPGTVTSPLVDPTGDFSGTNRVWRGGDYYNSQLISRSAFRRDTPPGRHQADFGFRLVRSLPNLCHPVDPCNGVGLCEPADGTCKCDGPNMTEDCGACLGGFTGYPDCAPISQ